MKVLVADNSALLGAQIIDLLSELPGIEIVGHARSAQEVLRAILEHKPDVVTMDIDMSADSGLDVLREIKRDASAPIVVMLTHSVAPPYRERAFMAGADFFLDKSTEFEKVPAIFQGLLDRGHGTRL